MLQAISLKKTSSGDEEFCFFLSDYKEKDQKSKSQLNMAKTIYLEQLNQIIRESLKEIDQKTEIAKNEEDYLSIKNLQESRKEIFSLLNKISLEISSAATLDSLKKMIPIELLRNWKR